MSKPDNQINELHLRDPKPGDFWHERFCPYHIVLAVTPSGVVIADKTRPDGDSHYTFDLESAREITHEEHAKAVRYSSGNGFAADVIPVRAALSVREWKAAGSKYITVAEQRAASHSGEALMDTNKMRDISREQFEEWCDLTCRSTRKDNCGNYESTMVDADWEAWRASREVVVVDLPDTFDKRDVQGLDYDKTVAAIEAQGLKVAP